MGSPARRTGDCGNSGVGRTAGRTDGDGGGEYYRRNQPAGGLPHEVAGLLESFRARMGFESEDAMRVVHYLNQFFGGIGAEEHAGAPLQARDGAVGPGRLLEALLGDQTRIVMTLVCGDNYAVENQQAVTASVVEKMRPLRADLFVAGPCFDAGRYG